MGWRGSVSDVAGTLSFEPLSITCDVKYCFDLVNVNQRSRVVRRQAEDVPCCAFYNSLLPGIESAKKLILDNTWLLASIVHMCVTDPAIAWSKG